MDIKKKKEFLCGFKLRERIKGKKKKKKPGAGFLNGTTRDGELDYLLCQSPTEGPITPERLGFALSCNEQNSHVSFIFFFF